MKLVIRTKRKTSRVFQNKAGWKTIAEREIYFRSSWEVRIAEYLQFLKEREEIKEWEHEPQTFWFEGIKRGVCSYKPDFKVIKKDGSHFWVEVKGYMDAKSRTKIKRFKKYFPNEELVVWDKKWFIKNLSRIPRHGCGLKLENT